MKPNQDKQNTGNTSVDEMTLMRLVDGELNSAERIQVLQKLESQRGGWRECALAFIEDQAWKQAMATPAPAAATTKLDSSVTKTIASPLPANSSQGMTWASWAAIAAGLILAFAAGSFLRFDNGGANNQVVQTDGAAKTHRQSRAPSNAIATNADPTEREQPKPQIAGDLAKPNAAPLEKESPVYVVDNEFWDHKSSLPEDFQERLEKLGVNVERKRGLMPIRTNDGQDWIVPYEELQVVPVNGIQM